MKILRILHIASIILILLSIAVSIPLSIKTIEDGGGTWGFGIIGIPILLPLSAYILFGFAGVFRRASPQWKLFLAAHAVTLLVGFITLMIMPVYPGIFVVIPLGLFILGLINKKRFRYFLLVMICLAIVANVLLLKWEFDFHRTLPLFQLF